MKLIVRRDDNEMTREYEVNEKEHTVADLKEMIAEQNFGSIVEEQRLEHKNKRLRNSHFLAYYNLKENDLLVLKQQSASSSSSNSSTPSVSDEENDAGQIATTTNNNQQK
jgi:hypothetical protein